ncbi:hypothetical protein [Oceanobacillus kimchii]|uniref:hypothetical protein n=1 Tax=Oceanobacillus kimchii TaxID=746691 RepID=UPI00232C67D4|nr:hypothetical protein [Oceanobacillus kimchii]
MFRYYSFLSKRIATLKDLHLFLPDYQGHFYIKTTIDVYGHLFPIQKTPTEIHPLVLLVSYVDAVSGI